MALNKNIFVEFKIILYMVGFMSLLHFIQMFLDTPLTGFGIYPRTISGLIGIFTYSFIHANLAHLISNAIPLLVLGTLVLLYGRKEFFSVTIAIMLLSGAAVWLIGRASYHVGASGLVFGYFGYLLAKGWYDRKFSSITIAIAVALLYGGMIWGIFPTNLYISWEAHLFGFLSGILIAKARKSK